jgi:beta-galactosidase
VLAIGYKGGKEVCRDSLVTTGPSADFTLTADRPTLTADGQDLSHIRVTLLDSAGFVSKMDARRLTVTVEGAGRLLGIDNGDMRRQGSFMGNTLPSYFGTALIRVQSGRTPGVLLVHVAAEGIEGEKTVRIEVK